MTGSSDIRTDTISSSGTYFARTTRQTVSGVAFASPIGPQIHVRRPPPAGRDLGHAGTLAVEVGFHGEAGDQLKRDEQHAMRTGWIQPSRPPAQRG